VSTIKEQSLLDCYKRVKWFSHLEGEINQKGHRGKRRDLYDLVIIEQQAGYDLTYSSPRTMCMKGHPVSVCCT